MFYTNHRIILKEDGLATLFWRSGQCIECTKLREGKDRRKRKKDVHVNGIDWQTSDLASPDQGIEELIEILLKIGQLKGFVIYADSQGIISFGKTRIHRKWSDPINEINFQEHLARLRFQAGHDKDEDEILITSEQLFAEFNGLTQSIQTLYLSEIIQSLSINQWVELNKALEGPTNPMQSAFVFVCFLRYAFGLVLIGMIILDMSKKDGFDQNPHLIPYTKNEASKDTRLSTMINEMNQQRASTERAMKMIQYYDLLYGKTGDQTLSMQWEKTHDSNSYTFQTDRELQEGKTYIDAIKGIFPQQTTMSLDSNHGASGFTIRIDED